MNKKNFLSLILSIIFFSSCSTSHNDLQEITKQNQSSYTSNINDYSTLELNDEYIKKYIGYILNQMPTNSFKVELQFWDLDSDQMDEMLYITYYSDSNTYCVELYDYDKTSNLIYKVSDLFMGYGSEFTYGVWQNKFNESFLLIFDIDRIYLVLYNTNIIETKKLFEKAYYDDRINDIQTLYFIVDNFVEKCTQPELDINYITESNIPLNNIVLEKDYYQALSLFESSITPIETKIKFIESNSNEIKMLSINEVCNKIKEKQLLTSFLE